MNTEPVHAGTRPSTEPGVGIEGRAPGEPEVELESEARIRTSVHLPETHGLTQVHGESPRGNGNVPARSQGKAEGQRLRDGPQTQTAGAEHAATRRGLVVFDGRLWERDRSLGEPRVHGFENVLHDSQLVPHAKELEGRGVPGDAHLRAVAGHQHRSRALVLPGAERQRETRRELVTLLSCEARALDAHLRRRLRPGRGGEQQQHEERRQASHPTHFHHPAAPRKKIARTDPDPGLGRLTKEGGYSVVRPPCP